MFETATPALSDRIRAPSLPILAKWTYRPEGCRDAAIRCANLPDQLINMQTF
jgi:hypothetical protein